LFLAGGAPNDETLILCGELEDALAAYFTGDARSKEPLVNPGIKALTAPMFQLSLYAKS